MERKGFFNNNSNLNGIKHEKKNKTFPKMKMKDKKSS